MRCRVIVRPTKSKWALSRFGAKDMASVTDPRVSGDKKSAYRRPITRLLELNWVVWLCLQAWLGFWLQADDDRSSLLIGCCSNALRYD